MNVSLHRARTSRTCGNYPCKLSIEPGELYVRHVAFPCDDGHEDGARPWVIEDCFACADRMGEWVRSHYGVPAHLGGRVVFDGQPGTIVSLHGGNVHVRLDATGKVVPVHPVWRMAYETVPAEAVAV